MNYIPEIIDGRQCYLGERLRICLPIKPTGRQVDVIDIKDGITTILEVPRNLTDDECGFILDNIHDILPIFKSALKEITLKPNYSITFSLTHGQGDVPPAFEVWLTRNNKLHQGFKIDTNLANNIHSAMR